jgi:peptidoglycan glycosyltransferase
LNRATQGLYPPGSIFKAVTATAALESGKFTPESRFDDPGYCIQYGKPVFNAGNHDMSGPSAYGNVNLFTAFENSINSVFCKIGQQLGAGAVLEQAKRFGFYSSPPIELPPGERSPSGLYRAGTRRLFDPESPDPDVDPGRFAFGQERLLVTPLQMAMVAGAIANDGAVMKPRLVKRIVSPGGQVVVRSRPQKLGQAMKPETAQAVNAMMVAAVENGTGTNAQISGVTVAGKTGTAETGTPGVYHTWFIFFAPAENPIVAGAVVVESQPGGFGGTVAAPIARQLMEAILPVASNLASEEDS